MLIGLLLTVALFFLAIFIFAKVAKAIFIVIGILAILFLLPFILSFAGIALGGFINFGYSLPLLIIPLIKVLFIVFIISLIIGGIVWLFRQSNNVAS